MSYTLLNLYICYTFLNLVSYYMVGKTILASLINEKKRQINTVLLIYR